MIFILSLQNEIFLFKSILIELQYRFLSEKKKINCRQRVLAVELNYWTVSCYTQDADLIIAWIRSLLVQGSCDLQKSKAQCEIKTSKKIISFGPKRNKKEFANLFSSTFVQFWKTIRFNFASSDSWVYQFVW